MDDNIDNSNIELKDIIENLQNENKKLKTDLHITKILKDNYESGKENEINYIKEIFNIIKDDIYMQNRMGPKVKSSDKNSIKFCINELYNTCKSLEIFMKNNNIKNRFDLIKNFKNNNIVLKSNILEDVDIISESVKNIVIDEKKEVMGSKNKILCSFIPSRGKNKNIQCYKYVNNETKDTNYPLCSIHKK